ncbi:MAG: 4-hydroxy-3-methylbut-2-enyl diphosphate reductase, partial [Candidatus Saccharimonadales bacterium]
MKVLLANPHGFCAGVVMVVKALDRALEILGAPLYVFHEIVHNKHVVERFRERGVVFVNEISDVPEGANLLYSAHGVSPQVREEARARRLRTIDATCPLVTKVHHEVRRFA